MFSIALWMLACQTDDPSKQRDDSTVGITAESTEDGCVNDRNYFEQKVWGEALSPVCYSCHNAQGAAQYSDLVLQSNVFPDYLEVNHQELTYVASLEIEDTSLILRKPLGLDSHGGGAVLSEDSEAFLALVGFVNRLENPIEDCPGDEEITTEQSDLILSSPTQTLRKITLNLLGRLPSESHRLKVETNGEIGLQRVIDELLSGTEVGYSTNTKETISNRLVVLWNDILLTDKYLQGQQAIQRVDYDIYPNLYWYSVNNDSGNYRRTKVNTAIAREPLELMRHVFMEDLHWSNILTADYQMMNSWSARSYGVVDERFVEPDLDDSSSDVFYPVSIDHQPQVGILSSLAFLNRFPTTDTNRNRHRSKVIYETFLNTDILALASRPIDADNSAIHNPTMNDPQCNVCHSVMEPLAGAFQNWDADGHYNPPETGWFGDMYEPGLDGNTISVTESDQALRWVAERIAEDPRFARSTVEQVFEAFTGLEIIKPYEWSAESVEYAAWKHQDRFLRTTTQAFMDGDWNIKIPIKAVLLSKYFRAIDHQDATEAELLNAGTARLLTPEELHRKILSTTGYEWGDVLLDEYRLLYGGIDSDDVVERLTVPNGVIGAVALRMSNYVACKVTSSDFVLHKNQRRLFPYVETTYEPYSPDGYAIPEVQELIKKNIQYLYWRLLGEEVELNDTEVLETYALWLETYQVGNELIDAGEESTQLMYTCRAFENPNTGVDLPYDLRVNYDPNYTIRAWRSVLIYMLSDYKFLFE